LELDTKSLPVGSYIAEIELNTNRNGASLEDIIRANTVIKRIAFIKDKQTIASLNP